MQPSHSASRHFNPAASVKVLAILIMIAGVCPCSAGGTRIATTTTTLSVSPGEVTAGTAVTLTATVTVDGAPFARGRVVFCDANAARCNDSAIFGQAQSFLDIDIKDSLVGTAELDPATLGFVLLPGFNSPAIVGSQPQNTLLGDFNNDGKLDLAATNGNANTVSVLLGNGDGTFQPQTAYDAQNAPIAIVSGDFNRDGRPDPPGRGTCQRKLCLG